MSRVAPLEPPEVGRTICEMVPSEVTARAPPELPMLATPAKAVSWLLPMMTVPPVAPVAVRLLAASICTSPAVASVGSVPKRPEKARDSGVEVSFSLTS